MLHEVAANILLGMSVTDFQLTDEQNDVVQRYVEFVSGLKEETGGELFVEQRFRLPHHKEFWGTSDAVIASEKSLHVIDLKAGRGVAVEVQYAGKLNPQLGYYCLGAIASLGRTDWEDIEIIVVQPRFGGIKRRKVTMDELNALAEELLAAAKKAELKDPPFEAGSHCKFCPARFNCTVLREFVFEIAKGDFDAVSTA